MNNYGTIDIEFYQYIFMYSNIVKYILWTIIYKLININIREKKKTKNRHIINYVVLFNLEYIISIHPYK